MIDITYIGVNLSFIIATTYEAENISMESACKNIGPRCTHLFAVAYFQALLFNCDKRNKMNE